MAIYNFGSLNIDHVYQVSHFVRPGETMKSTDYRKFGGGKGANQSVALGRAGSTVYHIGKIGTDGEFLRTLLVEAHVDVRFLSTSEDEHTGHAIIQVDSNGENCIFLYGGTNQSLSARKIQTAAESITPEDFVLLQNETNLVPEIIKAAKQTGATICFNPAPMSPEVKDYPLDLVNLLILNQTEGAELAGLQVDTSPMSIINQLSERYPNCDLLLTLGAKGAIYRDAKTHEEFKIAATPVEKVVDTTGAGDTYVGYFLSSREHGCSIVESMVIASRAAAITVSRRGAISATPYSYEL